MPRPVDPSRRPPAARRPAALALGLACLAWLAIGAAPRTAAAAPWLTLDQASAEPSELPGMARVRLYVSAIALQGSVIDIAPRDWSLQVGGGRRKIPYIVGSYDAVAGAETAIVVVLQLSRDYEEYAEEGQPTLRPLDKIREELTAFLDTLPKKTQVAIVGFGESVQGSLRFVPANQAAKQLEKLSSESEPAPPVLLKALDRAIRALARKAKPSVPGAPLRRMIVVFSDGQDEEPSPERYRSVGRRADKDEVRIHSIAFSPGDQRTPLLGLGELSKRSHGTFRWVRTTAQLDGFKQQLANLNREIQRQYVLTFFLPPDEVQGKRFKVSTSVGGKELVSGEARVDKLTCGAGVCSADQWCAAEICVSRALPEGRGFFGWLLLLGGIGVVGLGAVGGVVWLLARRGRGGLSPGIAPPGALPPGALPPGAPGGPPPAVPPGPPPGQIMGQIAGQPHAGHPGHPAHPGQPGHPGHGYPQPPATGAHAAAPAPQAYGPSLLVLTGPHEGKRIPLRHGFSMGKAPGSDLDLSADPYASGQHAQVLVDTRGGCTLVDRNSTNGTFINGVRLLGQQPLSHGMLIRLGSTDVRFLQQ